MLGTYHDTAAIFRLDSGEKKCFVHAKNYNQLEDNNLKSVQRKTLRNAGLFVFNEPSFTKKGKFTAFQITKRLVPKLLVTELYMLNKPELVCSAESNIPYSTNSSPVRCTPISGSKEADISKTAQ